MSKLYIVGIGPGGPQHLTPAARAAIESAGTVVGYRPYLDLIASLLDGKETVASGMRQEVERCRQALTLAAGGTVALVSSGDAGVYGMAGLALELAETWKDASLEGVDIEIVPGISALQAAAACLGAPLMHDFAVISLSDLLTPWETIARRLAAAAAADFVTVLYNPRSRGRTAQLGEALAILRRHRSPATPLGIVRNAGRAGEEVTVATLGNCPQESVDMLSLVIVGNSTTFVDQAGRMVTRRGYAARDEEKAEADLLPLASRLSPAPARALFIGGTGSDVGKSVIAAGICRLLRRRGYSVAPFKAQNMALNSAVTPEGGEIGRAQALQAAACGLPPHTDMNPVLLKPTSDTGSQVIIQGRPVGNMTVRDYHAFKAEAFARVRESFERLAAGHQVVVMEGAGSIAEINLRAHDIANLRAAAMAEAPVLLVADIDRGGVFAAIVGTLELLRPEERARVAGVIINKFRGDPSLLASGISAVAARTGVPVLGVVPWLELRPAGGGLGGPGPQGEKRGRAGADRRGAPAASFQLHRFRPAGGDARGRRRLPRPAGGDRGARPADPSRQQEHHRAIWNSCAAGGGWRRCAPSTPPAAGWPASAAVTRCSAGRCMTRRGWNRPGRRRRDSACSTWRRSCSRRNRPTRRPGNFCRPRRQPVSPLPASCTATRSTRGRRCAARSPAPCCA